MNKFEVVGLHRNAPANVQEDDPARMPVPTCKCVITGVVIHRVTPTVLDLWYSIGSVNRFLKCYCAATLTFGCKLVDRPAMSDSMFFLNCKACNHIPTRPCKVGGCKAQRSLAYRKERQR